MLIFDKQFKLYLDKKNKNINLSIKVSDICCNTYYMTMDEFELILNNWRNRGGYEFRFGKFKVLIQHKLFGPRPERTPANYVRITIEHDMIYQYRVNYEDMEILERDYNYQKNNVMYYE